MSNIEMNMKYRPNVKFRAAGAELAPEVFVPRTNEVRLALYVKVRGVTLGRVYVGAACFVPPWKWANPPQPQHHDRHDRRDDRGERGRHNGHRDHHHGRRR